MSAQPPEIGRREGPAPARPLASYGLLLVTSIMLLALQGILSAGAVPEIAVTALAGVALLLALRVARVRESWLRVAAGVAATALVISIVRAITGGIGEGAARAMNAALIALGPPAVAVGVVRDLRTSGRVRLEAVMGVLSLYILIGMVYGFVYGAVDQLGGAPFFAGGAPATVSNCVYFSFTTLTTVGFGDFVARSNVGHTLAIFEALTGQIYLVTVVSLLVGNLGRTHQALEGRRRG